jgi:hypothetical protein
MQTPRTLPRKPFLAQGLTYQGRHPQAAEACSEFLSEPTADALEPPRWLQRVMRWVKPIEHWLLQLHDAAERRALTARVCSLEHLEDDVRTEIAELRAVQFTGSAQAAAEAARQIKARGDELDRMREEHLRLLAKLQMLDGGRAL